MKLLGSDCSNIFALLTSEGIHCCFEASDRDIKGANYPDCLKRLRILRSTVEAEEVFSDE